MRSETESVVNSINESLALLRRRLDWDTALARLEEFDARAEGPRAGTYTYSCAALMTLALAPLSRVFNMIWDTFWTLSGESPVFEQGTLIHTFSFFLVVMGVGIALLAAAMHRYHTLAPPNLNQLIRNLQESHS